MAYYENVFIARPEITPQQVEELTANVSKIIADQGGKVTKTESWGLRNLKYKIKKSKKGHYVLLNIDAPAAAVIEMERNMRINEDVLRYLTIKVDELEAGPSAMLRKDEREYSDRDDFVGRPARGGGGREDRGYRPSRRAEANVDEEG